MVSSMESNEAREALAAADAVERRAAESVPAGGVSGFSIALTGAIAGLVVFFVLQGWLIATFITCFALMGLALWVGAARHRNVRPAVKQDVDTTEGEWSWKSFLGFAAAYSVMFIAVELLPKGNTGISAAAGAVAAVAWSAAMWWGKRHGWMR